MKTNKMMRIASVLLVAVLLTTCVISGTFAKYTTSKNASDSARVAKWDIDFDASASGSETKEFTFDLFNTVKDTNGTDNETDVRNLAGDGDTVIAPGTSGSFDIVLQNLSEVTAKGRIELDLTGIAGVPLEFKIGTAGDWSKTPAALENIELAMEGEAVTTTIQWRWAIGDGSTDVDDTNLGTAGTLAEPVVKAIVTVEQVD